jgi:hypothetical protein
VQALLIQFLVDLNQLKNEGNQFDENFQKCLIQLQKGFFQFHQFVVEMLIYLVQE